MSRVPGSRRRLTTSSPPASSTRTGSAATRWRGSGRLPRDGRQPMTLLIAATGDVPTRLGELLLGRATKVAAVLLAAFVVERLARWMVGRGVRGIQRQGVQQRLQSIRARTPRALLATTDPLPSLRHAQRADAIGAVLRNLSSVVIWLLVAMLLEDQYGVGDVVDVGEATGEVERVGLRTTRLRGVDGTVWHVRNGDIERVG